MGKESFLELLAIQHVDYILLAIVALMLWCLSLCSCSLAQMNFDRIDSFSNNFSFFLQFMLVHMAKDA